MAKVEWLAGLLEGEGCFDEGGGRNNPTPQVRLAMTDEDIVRRAAMIFPGSTPIKVREHRQENRKDVTLTSWHGKSAVHLMWMILPYMGIRRTEKILTILADYFERKMKKCSHCGIEFSSLSTDRDSRISVCSVECNRKRKNTNQNASRAIRMERSR